MARKRKGRSSTARTEDSDPQSQSAKLLINSYEDVADSEDEFHINQDKVLLDEGPARKRQRQLEEEGKSAAKLFSLALFPPR